MRKSVIVAAFSVLTFGLCAGIAGAQVPTSGNVYFGYTYYNTNLAPNRGGLNGWQGTLEGKLFPLLGIVADLTGQYGSLDLGEICPVVPVGGGGGGCTTFNRARTSTTRCSVRGWGRRSGRFARSANLKSGLDTSQRAVSRTRRLPRRWGRRNGLQDFSCGGLEGRGGLRAHALLQRGAEQCAHFDRNCAAVLSSRAVSCYSLEQNKGGAYPRAYPRC